MAHESAPLASRARARTLPSPSADMCCTTKTGAPNVAGSCATRPFNASSPPADVPTTTTHPRLLMTHDSIVRGSRKGPRTRDSVSWVSPCFEVVARLPAEMREDGTTIAVETLDG